ncbi:unnamed protein product [Phytomonas sp. Hart1]|nr:unnamed protein product [Phytomonas sp. Hart1]|eukprot:CCW71403.1 unnamed protein product [Phytomonas sp. isolate Hart1]
MNNPSLYGSYYAQNPIDGSVAPNHNYSTYSTMNVETGNAACRSVRSHYPGAAETTTAYYNNDPTFHTSGGYYLMQERPSYNQGYALNANSAGGAGNHYPNSALSSTTHYTAQTTPASDHPTMQTAYDGSGNRAKVPAVMGSPEKSLEEPLQPPPEDPIVVNDENLCWTWATYPNTAPMKEKDGAAANFIPLPEMVVPLACMYKPLGVLSTKQLVRDSSAQGQCGDCGAFLSRHGCRPGEQQWVCFSCQRRHTLPPNYTEVHPARLYDTVEYILPGPRCVYEDTDLQYPVFLFLVDVCLHYEELNALKANLLRCLEWLPSRSLIGIIYFGARTTVWELGNFTNDGIAKNYIICGNVPYEDNELPKQLQVSQRRPVQGRFLLPLEDCHFALTTLIEEIQGDSEPLPSGRRPMRTTGTAVSVAVYLLESLRQNSGLAGKSVQGTTANLSKTTKMAGDGAPIKTAGKILLFTSGPCTRGSGAIVGPEKAEMMRFHRDIIEDNTPYYASSYAFYNKLATRLSAVGACLDVFSFSLDQTGVMEMRNCINLTGGTLICGDFFAHEQFSNSLKRYFDRCGLGAGREDLEGSIAHCGLGVSIETHTSANTLVSGVLGPCNVDMAANKAKPHRATSPVQIGVGGTTRWCVSTLDQCVTFAFVFDTAILNETNGIPQGRRGGETRFIQFVTTYTTVDGQRRVRVTSTLHPVAPQASLPIYYTQLQAFDQTCASTVIARMLISILEKFPKKWDDTKRWLDTLLVKFVRRYGTYTPNLPDSLRLSPCLSLFPSFMFNLRRSEYMMVINISPDETTFKRHWLMREPVDNCVRMIQPTLDRYDLEAPHATAVPLDSGSLRGDAIVLMDAFFNLHIMWGSTIFEWIQAGYHKIPDYAHFAGLLEVPETDAQALLALRHPYPRFSRTDANGSEARHIKTRVNPSVTYSQAGGGSFNRSAASAGDDCANLIYTDEASIEKFMSSLKQMAVSAETKP